VAITNPSAHLTDPKSLPSSQRRVTKLNLSALATLICQLKKTNPLDAKTSELVTTVIRQRTNSAPDTGPVKRGNGVVFMADKTIHELEVEFTEWKTQQKHIVEKVDQLHSDMSEVKKAVFQAKWMLVGGLVFAGLMNSDAFIAMLMRIGGQ